MNLHTNGRLGNQMSTFATLYAYAKAMRLQAYLYRDGQKGVIKVALSRLVLATYRC